VVTQIRSVCDSEEWLSGSHNLLEKETHMSQSGCIERVVGMALVATVLVVGVSINFDVWLCSLN
jgi:hypothetical protein